MQNLPAFYVLGTKYGIPALDMLPAMLEASVISIGFAHSKPLPQFVGLAYEDALSKLRVMFPKERPDARTQLARFFAIRPGDLIALKASGSPLGKQPRLVIARYAVVAGQQNVSYQWSQSLGHTIAVNFLDEMDSIEMPLGYGRTLHHITKVERINRIFGAYADAANLRKQVSSSKNLKSTHTTVVASRGEYLMRRVHNDLQNMLYEFLRKRYGDAARLEEDNIDIAVDLPGGLLLIEVKSSPSPTYCIREAFGQMLHYAWRGGHELNEVQFLVVGPSNPVKSDNDFLSQVNKATSLRVTYSTPDAYIASAARSDAVGTGIAPRPPHRSVRAELPHTAPASGNDDQPPPK